MTGNAGILSQDVSTRGGGLLLTDISHFLNIVLQGNSADKLCYPRSGAYSAELVLLNKHQISGGRAYLHCYLLQHTCKSTNEDYVSY